MVGNDGSSVLSVSGVTLVGFTNVAVSFNPTSAVEKSTTLRFTTNDPDEGRSTCLWSGIPGAPA